MPPLRNSIHLYIMGSSAPVSGSVDRSAVPEVGSAAANVLEIPGARRFDKRLIGATDLFDDIQTSQAGTTVDLVQRTVEDGSRG